MDMPDSKSAHEPEKEPSPQFIPPPTASGRQWQFPQQYHDFLPNSTTQNCHICQRGLLFVHHFHSPQSWGLHHQCSQKVVSLNLKLLPPNLMNLAFFVSMKLIPLWYLTRTKVLMTAVMLLDLQVLLVDQVWMQNSRPLALYPSPEYLHAIS